MSDLTVIALGFAGFATLILAGFCWLLIRLVADELAASREVARLQREAHEAQLREMLLHLRDPIAAVGHSFALSEGAREAPLEAPQGPQTEHDEIDDQLEAELRARGFEVGGA